ncbi:cytochrome P450 [Suhomyces tanzawaensis NRRL Y-17324]|uniref:Cytochrome P450 n=1 Tax=Suhomyces tanzawaensis NRRL Y-17324 TaxID=984487 RepID=A0A1E4SBD0_9ASCO|nr:cytochrome P450 [Suhomyces tanzawaensis NRRL Y-17324]ODV76712.1 cytochrome P450 [Suhomyces tanzawaensis NRRL Y-17324]
MLSPLRHIPGPYLNRVSVLRALHGQRARSWISSVHQLHLQYGNVVVVAPNEISVNGDPKYLHDIYVKNFPKSQFYGQFGNHGHPNMFSSLANDVHLRYKRVLTALYSKLAIFSPKNTTRANLVEKIGQLVQAVDDSSRTNLGIDVYSLFASLAMDVVLAFELGASNGTDLLLRPDKRHIIISHRQVALMGFWTTLMPRLWNWAAGTTILQAAQKIEAWQLSIYSHAENNVPAVPATANVSTLEALKKHGYKERAAYSFLSDNIFAGHETTAIQLTYLTYELSRPANLAKQQRLVDGLREAFGVPGSSDAVIDDLERVDTLPYLNALLDENSRVHTSIPGAEPRVVDRPYLVTVRGGRTVALPRGTTISCQPYSVHRQREVFPDAYLFIPERWLAYEGEPEDEFRARIKRQTKFMMPFGKGVRMCLGMNLALIEMKLAVANLYWHYQSRLCSDWCEISGRASEGPANPIGMGESSQGRNTTDEEKMVMVDTYTTRPLNDECWLEWYRHGEVVQ